MDTISRNIVDLAADQRTVLEQVVGSPLSDAQQVIIQVVDVEPKPAESKQPLTVADYAIFADLDDEIVDELIEATRHRSPGREFDLE